jgi:hypothetical protein
MHKNLIVRKLFQFNKDLYLKIWAKRICFKTLLILFLFEAWEQMLNFTSFERQEINLVFKIKVFVGSKFWYFDISQNFGLLHISLPSWRRPKKARGVDHTGAAG